MKEIVNEILSEWGEKLTAIKTELNNYNVQIQILKEVGYRDEYILLRKFFVEWEIEAKRSKINENILKLTDRQQNLFKTKCSSLTNLDLLKEKNSEKPEPIIDNKPVQQEALVDPFVREEKVEPLIVPVEKQKQPEEKPKKKIKNLLDNLKLKSKTKEENKENIVDQTIIIENGEINILKNKEKKRLKEYLKEGLTKKEESKGNKQELVYDVGTNKFVDQNATNNQKIVLQSWNKSPSLKDGLYKRAIDKERYKYKALMNTYKPKHNLIDPSSDDEGDNLTTDEGLYNLVLNQDHDEIARYFGCEQSIDIEMLFPNIKDISNDSPNKWL